MTGLRAWAGTYRGWAALLLAAVLVMRLLPAGTMVATAPGTLTLDVVLCSGTMAGTSVAIPIERGPGDPTGHDKAPEKPCSFVALGELATGGALPAFAVAAIAFALLLAVRAAPLPVRFAARLRPPLRGPPQPA